VQAARQSGVPFELIKAVIEAESGYEVYAVSPRGAQGLMQLMPAVMHDVGVSHPFNATENIVGGSLYLRSLLDRFSWNLPVTLAAWNFGPNRVLTEPWPAETTAFVRTTTARYHALKERCGTR